MNAQTSVLAFAARVTSNNGRLPQSGALLPSSCFFSLIIRASDVALINRVFSSLFFQHRVKCTLRPPVHGINRNFKLHPCALSTRRHSATITGRVSLFGKYVATPLSSGFKPGEIRNEILLRSFFFFFDVSEDELYEDA